MQRISSWITTLSDGVYTHQFTTLNSLKASELINGGENQRFVLRAADRHLLGEAIIEAQESQSRQGLEVKSCINGKASGFLLFNNLDEAKRSSLKRRNLNRGEDLEVKSCINGKVSVFLLF